jgi:hypothetical protein
MSMQDLSAIADVVAAIGVVISLFYLAAQIRQNTRQINENTNALRAAAVHTGLQLNSINRIALYSTDGTADVWLRGLEDPESLNPTERLRFRLICSNIVDAFFNAYSQTKATNLSPETWIAQIVTVKRIVRTKGGEWFWRTYSKEYRQDFCNEISRILAEGDARDA